MRVPNAGLEHAPVHRLPRVPEARVDPALVGLAKVVDEPVVVQPRLHQPRAQRPAEDRLVEEAIHVYLARLLPEVEDAPELILLVVAQLAVPRRPVVWALPLAQQHDAAGPGQELRERVTVVPFEVAEHSLLPGHAPADPKD